MLRRIAGRIRPAVSVSRVWRACIRVATVLGLAAGSLAQAQTFEPVELRTSPEAGYGRMVLTFQDRTLLPIYDAVITGGVLRISFEDPIDIDVDDVPLSLSEYITIARRDPDGSAIRFALKDRFKINTLEAGEKLFVDILPLDWQGLPPGLPDDVVRELAKRAEEAIRKARALEQARLKAQEGPSVILRIGEHPTFTRLVFDWSLRFDTAFVREDDIIRVTFNHPANLDISHLRANLPDGVVDATAFLDKGKLKFLMRIEPSVDIRAFREDQTYVLDITPSQDAPPDPVNAQIDEELSGGGGGDRNGLIVAPGSRNPEPVVPQSEAAPPPAVSGSNETPTNGADPAAADERNVAAAAAPPAVPAPAPTPVDPETAPIASADAERQVNTADLNNPDGSPITATPDITAAQRIPGEVADVTAAIPQNDGLEAGGVAPTAVDQQSAMVPETAPPVTIDPNASAAPDAVPPAVVIPTDESTAEVWRARGGADAVSQIASPEQPPANFADQVRNFVVAEARRIGNTVRVVFPFGEPVSSAVFRRNDNVWIVFDTDATIETRGMVSALSDMAETIDVSQYDGFQVLRIDLSDPVLATVGLDGNAWSLVIGDMILEPSIPLRLERNIRGDGGSILRVLYKDPQNIRKIEDPFVGDAISLVTGFGPPRGLLKAQNFVDLNALSSAQGVAIAAKSDDVSVKILGDDIIIEKDGGLALSNKHLRGGTGVFNSISNPNESDYVEFVSLTTEGPETYRDQLRRLQEKLSATPEGRRSDPLMELSRFYLAHQFAQEALGLMQLALEEDPALAEDSSFNLMLGAAQAMANRPDEAYAHLNRPDLKNSPDAAIWQTIVDVALGHWTQARIAMPRGRAVIGNYPPAIQTEFNLAAAQAMVESNDFGLANSILAEIEPSDVARAQAARYDILRGRVADASGRSQEALTVFDLVSRSDDRPRAAEAEYRALRIRYRDGEIGIDEAIDQLAGLSLSWRGDEIELKTLRFLAQLNAEKGQYRQAFEAMKSAVQADPESETTRLLQEEMNSLFVSLFLDGKADDMSPVRSLALYYDFRELTPIGRQGDEMVRLLAKRLVGVDLLDQATELLRHQVDNRLKGAARAQIAADLAAIYLMDRKPDQALRVLNRTRQASLPSTLERQRNIVEARALTSSGRPDLALELVRNMRGSDVDRLRADTFWAAQSWRDAGEQLEAMHGSRWSDNIPLDALERRDILRAGIAYSLAEDQLSLDRLQTKYMPKMANSPEALAFDVVTRPIEAQGVEFLEVANRLADTDSLETFMEEYRRQYMTPSGGSDQASVPGEGPDNG
ncbi:MAG: hypothetical protein JJ902_05980 [Roseibium sp.]|nr:hypothetical protein [Roseibium sp.]